MTEERRPSLLDRDEYSTSTIEGFGTARETLKTGRKEHKKAPGRTENKGSEVTQVEPEVFKLRERTDTGTEVYEVTRKVRVSRRYHKGKARSNLDDVTFSTAHSLLDELDNSDSQFKGFYLMGWMGIAVINLNFMVNYLRANGFQSAIISTMSKDLTWVALTDLLMYLSTYYVFFVQLLIRHKYITWHGLGWVMTSVYELCFIVFFMILAEHRNFPWIGKIFLFLHSIVQLMKMHSYSFYNGYLWNILEELKDSGAMLKKSEDISTEQKTHLDASIEFCTRELDSQSTTTPFPSNISMDNFFLFSMFPTVVYQIDYPRTKAVRPNYVIKKVCAVFGVLMLMVVVAQTGMHPIAMRAIELRQYPLSERIWQYPMLLLDLLPSFFLMYILVFYIIWDAILNSIAEITRFGDRDFYGEWWNCQTWYEFSKLWNKPVHKFLLRHVYHSSLSALKLSKGQATLFTFFVSSVVHELAMYVIFHRLRGYLLCCQMFQLPLIYVQSLPFMKNRRTLNNALFWVGIALGPSLMCTLYLTF